MREAYMYMREAPYCTKHTRSNPHRDGTSHLPKTSARRLANKHKANYWELGGRAGCGVSPKERRKPKSKIRKEFRRNNTSVVQPYWIQPYWSSERGRRNAIQISHRRVSHPKKRRVAGMLGHVVASMLDVIVHGRAADGRCREVREGSAGRPALVSGGIQYPVGSHPSV